MTSPARTTIGTRSCKAMRNVMAACSAPTVVCSMTAGSLPVDFDQPLAIETAVSSWRTETYSGISPGAHGLASASHSGAQSEPGEAKMRSTPMLRNAFSSDSAPVMRLFLAQAKLGKELAVAFVFATHVGCELRRRHRLGEVDGQRAKTLQHLRLLHELDDFAVQPLDGCVGRSRRRVEAEVRAAVDALDAVLLERRHVGKVGMALGTGNRDHLDLPHARLLDAGTRIEHEIDDAGEQVVEGRSGALI